MNGKTTSLIIAFLATCAFGTYSVLEVDAASINARASIGADSINVYWNDLNNPAVDTYDISVGKHSWLMPPGIGAVQDTRNHSPGETLTYTVCAKDKDVREPSSNAWSTVACDSVTVRVPSDTKNVTPQNDTQHERYPTNTNRAPNAVIVAPSTVFEDTLVELYGNRTSDPNRDDLTYFWNVTDYDGYIWAHGENTNFYAPRLNNGDVRLTVSLTVSDGELTDTATKSIYVRDNTPPQISGIRYSQSGNTLTVWPTVFDAENNIIGYRWTSSCGVNEPRLFSGTMHGSPLVVDVTNKTGSICLFLMVSDYQHSARLWTGVTVN